MEEDDNLRTIECLRGRLLAERMASRAAKEDAEQMGNKLLEVESKMKLEEKSRKRAEKRLRFLLKKLDSMNISYVSEDSEQSSFLRSEVSSVSSSSSSPGNNEPEDREPQKTQIKNQTRSDIEETKQEKKLSIVSKDSKGDVSEKDPSSNQSHCSPIEESWSSTEKAVFENASDIESSRSCNNQEVDDNR